MVAALRLLIMAGLLAWPSLGAAQRFDGAVVGTLDCPARSIFDSGSTQVRGMVRNNQLTVGLGPLTVTGRIVEIGPQPAVRLEGSNGSQTAAFDGLMVGTGQLHARGIVDERPCNLNLTLSVATAPPARGQATQPARALPSLDGPWAGSVSCPLHDVAAGDIPARGAVVDNVLSVGFGNAQLRGRIAGLSPRPALRLESAAPRGPAAGFDAVVVTPDRIQARGLVAGQPCTMTLTPARLTPQARPAPAIPQAPDKPPPTFGGVPPPPPSLADKPPPLGGPPAPSREPEPPRPPPVANATPRPAPAPSPTPSPPSASPRAPSPGAADQLACALAGTCPTPPR
jgi:hypothetical protein